MKKNQLRLPAMIVAVGFLCLCACAGSVSAGGVVEEDWNNTYYAGIYTDLFAMAPASDGGYLLGGLGYDPTSGGENALLFRTDNAGTVIWNTAFEGFKVSSIASVGDGTFVLTTTTENQRFGETGELISAEGSSHLIKTDGEGTALWDTSVANLIVRKVLVDDGGDLVVCGWRWHDDLSTSAVLVKYSADGDFLWEQVLGTGAAYDIAQAETGYMVTGVNSLENIETAWLLKTTVDGKEISKQTYENLAFYAMIPDGEGYFFTGSVLVPFTEEQMETRAVAVKADRDGTILWQQTLQGSAGYDALVLATNEYVVAGKWGDVAMTLLLDENGNELDSAIYQTVVDDNNVASIFHAVTSAPYGGFATAGWTGMGGETAEGWLVKYAPPSGAVPTTTPTSTVTTTVTPQDTIPLPSPTEAPGFGVILVLVALGSAGILLRRKA